MKLKVGDKIPNFIAKDSNGNDFDIQNVLGKKDLVIYFYPKDNTTGCTLQACSFRDQYQEFKNLNAEIIGISSDSIESHQKFIKKHNLPFLLLSDTDKKISTLFGVSSNFFGLLPGRVTFVVNKKGMITMVFENILMPSEHIKKSLESLKNEH